MNKEELAKKILEYLNAESQRDKAFAPYVSAHGINSDEVGDGDCCIDGEINLLELSEYILKCLK